MSAWLKKVWGWIVVAGAVIGGALALIYGGRRSRIDARERDANKADGQIDDAIAHSKAATDAALEHAREPSTGAERVRRLTTQEVLAELEKRKKR